MKNKKITIIGLGYVGLSLAAFLGNYVKVIGIDSNKEKLRIIKKGESYFHEPKINYYLKKSIKNGTTFTDKITSEIASSDFVFITVGTPIGKNGKIDLSNIKSVSKSIAKNMINLKNNPSIIIKSTVIPGTTMEVVKPILEKNNLKESINFDLLTNPEFLKEGSAMQDTILPHSIVIGGTNDKAIKKLIDLYKSVYRKKQKMVETNNITAEMIKYANNAFLATKISFINSIANICQKLPGTNVDKIAEIIGMDPRIGTQFLKAGPGYGGSCFPKDVEALINFSNDIGYNPILLDAVKNTNTHQVNTVMNLVKNNLQKLKEKKITILGLAFKENTDDIRESRSIKLINLLLKHNCNIVAHDPKAIENTQSLFKNKITYENSIKNAIINSDCIIIMTAWEDYKKLKEKDFLTMRNPMIIDTRRILNIKNKKIKYIGLGIGKY
jgi:UDPglucose 6-dehydrogenase